MVLLEKSNYVQLSLESSQLQFNTNSKKGVPFVCRKEDTNSKI